MDRITSMRVFARAAQLGSLSAAARQLDISPAMAAKHVDALEVRLGGSQARWIPLRSRREPLRTWASLDTLERFTNSVGILAFLVES